jgi:serine/threonine protein kinase
MKTDIINRRFGPYILLKRLAVGGMAEIFLALRLGPGPVEKLVVLKCILNHCNEDPDFVRLFYREAKLSCILQHPNVISVWSASPVAKRHTMAMEYLRGVTLDVMVSRAQERSLSIPIEVAVWIVINACDGLQYLHDLRDSHDAPLNIVHRDISPQNIFACYDGQCKLFDFGVAQFGSHEEDPHKGMLVGKYAYMSPEQCNGDFLDARSDLFSLAIVLYELCTGVQLFQKENDILTLNAVCNCNFTPPNVVYPDFPPFLEIVLMKALSFDASQRYQSVEEFSEDLRKFLKISGYKQTNEALRNFLAKLFAYEIQSERELLKEAVLSAEKRFGRVEPMEALRSYDSNGAMDGGAKSEGLRDSDVFDYINTPQDASVDISLSRIASLVSGSQTLPPISQTLPQVRAHASVEHGETQELAVKELAPSSASELKTQKTIAAQESKGRLGSTATLFIGIILGVCLGIGLLALFSSYF